MAEHPELEHLVGKKLTGWIENSASSVELCFEDGSRIEFLASHDWTDESFGAYDDREPELEWLVRSPVPIVGKPDIG